jgi:Ca-activated chloride channel family protein
LPLAPAVAACVPKDRDALLILDSSFSMLRTASGGISRFNLARQAVYATLDLMPDYARVALRLYGSESQAARSDCKDSVLKVPFAPAFGNRTAIKLALAASHARGLTPIAYALLQASGDFGESAADRTIVLVSDGGETCGGDPCAVAALLAGQGFVINTVALQPDIQGRRQLQCIAKATGGEYFAVPTAAQLQDKVMQALGICPIALLPSSRPDPFRLG